MNQAGPAAQPKTPMEKGFLEKIVQPVYADAYGFQDLRPRYNRRITFWPHRKKKRYPTKTPDGMAGANRQNYS